MFTGNSQNNNTNYTLLPTSLPPRTSNSVKQIDYGDIPLAPCGQPSGIHTPCLPGWIPVCCQHALGLNDQNSAKSHHLNTESNIISNSVLKTKSDINKISIDNHNNKRKKVHNNFKYEIKGKNSFKNE
jgi:hypothetical protein